MTELFLAGFVDGLKALGINVPSLLAQIVNFSLLLVILYILAYKPALRLLDQRRRRIQEGLAASDEAKRKLADTERTVEEEMLRARNEGQELIEQAKQIALRIQEEAHQNAREEADRLLSRARDEIQVERDSAISGLRREFADLTVTAAERVIGESLDRESHKRLIDRTLEESVLSGNSGVGGGDVQE